MKIIVVHYHLNPGGVTKIIEAQVRGLQNHDPRYEICIACGKSLKESRYDNVVINSNELLNYHEADTSPELFSGKVSAIISFLRSLITGETIIHSHNPGLGKNPALTLALYKLASEGIPIVNHHHDFPEDRPANMALLKRMIGTASLLNLQDIIYPDFKNYHYVVLNSCDSSRIADKGIPRSRIHMLHNPVNPLKSSGKIQRNRIIEKLGLNQGKMLCTYPVRAIQRKNLGEFILLAVLFARRSEFAVTMAPLNPAELPAYIHWKSFCQSNGIRVRFEAGEIVDYEELISISDFCITTSIREGFGMTYLEPWLAGTPVIGRELPCIIGDLREKGLKFPGLYERILVNENTDFKDLTQSDQEQWISGINHNPPTRDKFITLNPFLPGFLDQVPAEITEANKQIIQQHFSIEEYGKELSGIYQQISE